MEENNADYQKFLRDLQKWGSKPHKIGHCLGTRDAWKWVRKNKWEALGGKPFDQLMYSKIINNVNKALVEQLLDGHEIEFPFQMGSLILKSRPVVVKFKKGKLINNYRIDWEKTLNYWFEDKEALKKREVVKRIQKNIYSIKYQKDKAKFKNRHFYLFRANRNLVKSLGNVIENGRVLSENVNYRL